MSDTIKQAADEEGRQADREQGKSTDSSNSGNPSAGDGQDGGDVESFEITLDNEAPAGQQQNNELNARRRIARKREKALREAQEAISRGELPDNLRVNPEMPAAPSYEDYFTDAGLEKYGYDTNAANAAYQRDLIEWNNKSVDAKSHAQSQQAQRIQDYTAKSKQANDLIKNMYDQAERLNLPDFDEKEEAFRTALGEGVDVEIAQLFPEKAAAIIYHLGANPEKMAAIRAMGGTQAVVELTRLNDRLSIKPKSGQRSNAPDPDNGAAGGAAMKSVAGLKSAMDEAATKGDTKRYNELRQQWRKMGGK